jgi:hypothetical protein
MVEKSESQIQKEITEYLKERGIFFWRNNVGRKGYVKFGLKGSSDIQCLTKGKFLAIEIKDKAGIISEDQQKYFDKVNANGGLAVVCRSKDDVIRFLYRYI